MKVTGIKRDDGEKDYSIQHNGTNYRAVKSGSLFVCNGVKGTLKNIKDSIASGSISCDELEGQPVQDCIGTWDCVHPCALLVMLTDPVAMTKGVTDSVYKETRRTLSNYGWMLDGVPDTIRADKEMRNFKERETGVL